MTFKEVIGQEKAKARLLESVRAQRVPHAQLFLSKEGQGGLPLALAFAQYLVCETPTPTDACGACAACKKSAKGIHPDIHFTFPTVSKGDGKPSVSNDFLKPWRQAIMEQPYMTAQQWLQHLEADNKQGNITKDECVEIVKKLTLKSFEAPYKILILWLPEYLGKEGNRLLKIIEEPPPATYFILVTEQEDAILTTIVSRCQTLRLLPLSDEELLTALVTTQGISRTQAEGIVYMADGSYAEALSLLAHNDEELAPLFLDWVVTCISAAKKKEGSPLVQWAEKAATWGREQQKYFFRFALQFLRECLLLKLAPEQPSRIAAMHRERAGKFANYVSATQIQQMSDLFNQYYQYIERNVNAKIVWLNASVQIKNIVTH